MPHREHAVRSSSIAGGPSAAARHPPVRASAATRTKALPSIARPLLFDDEPALHLEMQRRAEFRAIEAERAGLVRFELDGRRLSRIEADHDVLGWNREPVCRVRRLLDVRQVDDDSVSDLGLDDVRSEMT